MSTRILHCSTSVENYNICIEQQVAGFSHRGPQPHDLIYLVVKVGKKTLCGARFKLDKLTNLKPWPDGDRYKHTLSLKELEYCKPFDIALLSQVGGKSWSIKYIQGSKPISDQLACDLLNKEFISNKIDKFIPFELDTFILPGTEAKALVDLTDALIELPPLTRDSIKIQATISKIGEGMGLKVWLPKSDRTRVFEVWVPKQGSVLNDLPLNYDFDTLKTIENIDVLWISGRTIIRAFEVEHTTSIYSGILRMADLMALQPNLSIKAHIVAPVERKEKVMHELSRPVFKHMLAPSCTFISYDSIEELAQQKMLKFIKDSILDDLSESALDSITKDAIV
ncbi:hypothetical protein ABID22_001058 [Pontibacter aydingkolensis]|uniref:Uncharacterized protein n=1 Tax=Pontibacter aydingkolensis TaxID=1911536 RepID=A0ABS7CSZ4_9BACT|nr:hypothetical protein [Pontibacter aydingkolensis]MBW7466968.1 hypothetical protein [Pontibacter aydingkolensis]